MSGWSDLEALGLRCRPLSGERPQVVGRYSPFRASWGQTVRTLASELAHLNAKQIVLGIDVQDRDIRLDGFPRAQARAASPAVQLSFDSRYGPLRYATGEYHTWQDNVRAIALGMEALRKVDRYGVSKRGEQYAGWRALPTGSDDSFGMHDRDTALGWLIAEYGEDGGPDATLRRAMMETHPDRGGDADAFRKVMRAKELIEA